MRVAFLTLGCKVNSYETEKMKINFEKKGHMVVAFEEKADAYIINTCTVHCRQEVKKNASSCEAHKS